MTPTPATDILAEQVAYYRALALEYEDHAIAEPGDDEVLAAFDAFAPTGHVLELACGPGAWTERLLRTADRVTAVDASPEMLARARACVGEERARFVQHDLFTWSPDRTYDAVVFGFWISHVPLDRFAAFWDTVARALAPGGRVWFVDDSFRPAAELIEGPASSTIERKLNDGTAFRAVKVPHEPAALQRALDALGWDIAVHGTAGPFYWGVGGRRG